MKNILYILLLSVILISCSAPTSYDEVDNFELSIDARLDTLGTDLYSLNLSSGRNSIQTIHRLSGTLLNNGRAPYPPQPVTWESSHQWTLTDTAYVVIRRTINVLGQWVNVDTVYVTGYEGQLVPTINKHSLSGTDGEINTVIAPITSMRGDTMVVVARFEDLMEEIEIILQ